MFFLMPNKRRSPIKPTPAPAVEVARVGDRTFTLRSPFCITTTDEGWTLSAELGLVDGQPRFRHIELQCHESKTPLEVQRLPWAKIAAAAVAANAIDQNGSRSAGSDARHIVEKVESSRPGRRRVDRAVLKDVLRHRAEGQRLGVRWDTYAAKRMGYSPAYLRSLASRATREGL